MDKRAVRTDVRGNVMKQTAKGNGKKGNNNTNRPKRQRSEHPAINQPYLLTSTSIHQSNVPNHHLYC
jgi:hypothetical protein